VTTFTYTYNFVNGNATDGDQVDQNFTDVKNYIDTELIRRDGTVAMTGELSLSGTPTASGSAATKGYADQFVHTHVRNNYTPPASILAAGTVLATTTITDPGYDIEIDGVGSNICAAITGLDLSNLWELYVTIDGTSIAGLRIPIVTAQQSLVTPFGITAHTTGTNCTITLGCVRTNGSQASLAQYGADSRYNYLDIRWRRKKV
jgi:hypothetical protein